MKESNPQVLIEAKDITKTFRMKRAFKQPLAVKALDGVSIKFFRNQTLGIAGESGSGKSTLAKILVGLIKPTQGELIYDQVKDAASIQLLFQNPYTSLNPRMKTKDALREVLYYRRGIKGPKALTQIEKLYTLLGLSMDLAQRYPKQLSGGQRQRVAIGRALASEPKLFILDEPTSNLDVIVSRKIVDNLMQLKDSFDTTYVFISHDLGLLSYVTERLVVTYRGKILERGPTKAILKEPLHPYTKLLMDSAARRPPKVASFKAPDEGGCVFIPRCPFRKEACKKEPPFFYPSQDRCVSCWLFKS